MEAVLSSSSVAPATPAPAVVGLAPLDYGLYFLVVLVWGSSWIAIHFQLGTVAPEVSLVWRFALGSAVTMAWAASTGQPLRQPPRTHLVLACLGLCMFSGNFLFFYYGGLMVPSGLLSVVFSLASIGNMAVGALWLGQRPDRRLFIAGLVGAAGVGALFGPQIAEHGLGGPALTGLLLCVGGTALFCCGNLVATVLQRRSVPPLVSTGWGMTYGTLALTLLALAEGRPFIVEWSVSYLAGLAFLGLPASVLAFVAYMRLLARIGAARAGYVTVLVPVVALAISTVVEDYRWTISSMIGLALVLAGNLMVLAPRRARR